MHRCVAIMLLSLTARAEIVDRAAVIVGRQIVTALELEEEVRITEFLNQTPLTLGLEERRAAADRIVQQMLIAREMSLSHYPDPSDAEIGQAFDLLRGLYATQHEFVSALAGYKLDEQTVRKHLTAQISALHFIEYRFRPELGTSGADLRSSYQEKAESWAAVHPGFQLPSFEDSLASLRAALIEKRTDQALDNWLKETRKQVRIVFLEQDLGAAEALRD